MRRDRVLRKKEKNACVQEFNQRSSEGTSGVGVRGELKEEGKR